jgi:hypothetical protein
MARFDKSKRSKLKIQRKPHYDIIAPGLALGYRRNDGAGAWVTGRPSATARAES